MVLHRVCTRDRTWDRTV